MIKAGDLVQIVKPRPCKCKDAYKSIGDIFIVTKIVEQISHCQSCGYSSIDITADFTDSACEIYRLKKIPPLSELESIEDKKEIEA